VSGELKKFKPLGRDTARSIWDSLVSSHCIFMLLAVLPQ
jgi:hypothetical protein